MKTILMKIALLCSVTCSSFALGDTLLSQTPVRLGLSLGTPHGMNASFTADFGSLVRDDVSLGTEIHGLQIFSVRGLLWEKPSSMSGFHGGPKVFLGLVTPMVIEMGGEFGWLYRFHSRLDIGLGLDVIIGHYIGSALKFNVGYLL